MTLRVIGAGFGRTGTSTLQWVLERLLGGRCYHMREVLAHPEHAVTWGRKARGEPADLARVLEGYVAAVDWPACNYYAELAETNPEAKVVLTLRDFDRWYESAHETIYAISLTMSRPPMRWMTRTRPHGTELRRMITDTVWGERGTFGGRFADREHAREVYERHQEEVRRTIPAERLLEWAPSDGWEPLCRFLDVPVPDEPIPRKNEREEMIAIRKRMTVVSWAMAPVTAPVALILRLLGR